MDAQSTLNYVDPKLLIKLYATSTCVPNDRDQAQLDWNARANFGQNGFATCPCLTY